MQFVYWIAWLAAYLLGSVSFSYLVAKQVAKIDIRQHGSGNAGATNTLRVLGKGPAALVLLLDALKGAVAVWFAMMVSGGEPFVVMMAGLLAVVGHNWPVFFRFKGGKGIATTIGVMVSVSFFSTLIAGGLGILAIVWTRYVSLGSLIFVIFLPIAMLMLHEPLSYVYISFIVTVLGMIRHYQNMVRLIQGKEAKLGESTSRQDQQRRDSFE